MPAREILQLGNPLLWEKSVSVDGSNNADLDSIITDLRDTLADFRQTHGFGRGIAAPQIARLKRVIFVTMPDRSFDGPLINPRITYASNDRVELWDACFSFPDLVVKVSRARDIEVAYTDEDGAEKILRAEKDLSELLQHEIDHLDGILAVQRALSSQTFATRAEYERMMS